MSWSRRASRTSRGGGGEVVGRALASIGGVDVDGGGTPLDGGDAPIRRGTKTDGASRRRGDSRRGGSRRGGARRGGEARGKDGEARGKDGEARGKDGEARQKRSATRWRHSATRWRRSATRWRHSTTRKRRSTTRKRRSATRQRRFATPSRDWRRRRWRFVFRSTTRRDPATRARARTRRAPRRVGDETDSLDGESSAIARVAFVGDVRSASACGDGGGDARGVAFGGDFARVRDARDGASRARAGFRRGGNARDSRRDGDGARRARVGARRREGIERLSRIRRVTDARLRRFDVAHSTRRDAAAQCDDASCRAWIDRATRVPVVETIGTSRSIATVRIPGPILLDPRLVGRVFAETCATRLRLREDGATYRLEPRDPKQVTVFDCLAAAVDVLERIDRDGENRHGLVSNENRHGLVSNENRHGLVSNENRHGLVSNENRHGLVSNENRHGLVSNSNAGPTEDSGSRSPGRLTPVDSRSPASLITVDSILASARYHAERGDAKCAAFARFTAMTPSTGTGRGSRRRPPFDASRLDAADPATRSAAFEAHCAFLDCARRLCANARSRAGVARGSNRDRRTDTLRALAPWREGAVAVSRDDALDVLAAACHTHAPERLPAWRRAEEANARGGTSASEVDLDALLATLVDAWARGEAPADWATAPKRRRADERPEPTVVVPRVSKRLSTRTETETEERHREERHREERTRRATPRSTRE